MSAPRSRRQALLWVLCRSPLSLPQLLSLPRRMTARAAPGLADKLLIRDL